ncbi:hypothetical protein NC653_020840 [Populus alba x Populus x berolinensis]|uniref:ZNF598/HEL2 PAH domain-containing protein n=1 Tax=Populus alba x Populus x berolinensis TaxID=444605 RepID=A0AAD6MN98_9ROSI|nr:hypothetical protein NC653_020840 [Populus alba x Populus x berolinensis]
MEGIQTENQSSVEPALEFDGHRYNTFKCISREFCLGPMGACGQQFGLCHLVPDLARLCPDSTKQKELLATYNKSICRKQYGSAIRLQLSTTSLAKTFMQNQRPSTGLFHTNRKVEGYTGHRNSHGPSIRPQKSKRRFGILYRTSYNLHKESYSTPALV